MMHLPIECRFWRAPTLGASLKAGWCYPHSTCSIPAPRLSAIAIKPVPSHSRAIPIFLSHKLFFILVSINCTEALGFVMWSAHSKIYCSQASTRITKLSVGLEKERGRLCNEWKAHVFKKTIRSVGGHVPRAGCACQNRNGIRADEILAGRSRGMEATPAGCPIQRKNCEPPK